MGQIIRGSMWKGPGTWNLSCRVLGRSPALGSGLLGRRPGSEFEECCGSDVQALVL